MGNNPGMGNEPKNNKQDQPKKKPPPPPPRVGKKKKNKGVQAAAKLPTGNNIFMQSLRLLSVD